VTCGARWKLVQGAMACPARASCARPCAEPWRRPERPLAGALPCPEASRASGYICAYRSTSRPAFTNCQPAALVSKLIRLAGEDPPEADGPGGGCDEERKRAALEAICTSNHQLVSIGINLNQSARRLNASSVGDTHQEAVAIKEAAEGVLAHLREATAVLAALRPGRRSRRAQIGAMVQSLTEFARAANAGRLRCGNPVDQSALVNALTGAIAHLNAAMSLVPAPLERGWGNGSADGSSQGDGDGKEVD
jgi:hypothetical protein